MITKMAITLVIGAVMTLSTSTAQADTWTLPPEKQVMSADGNWRLTIYPREIEGRGEYFRDKVDGREPAGSIAGSRQTSAVGQLERKREGRWHTAWKRPIANEVSPVDAVVSNAGVAVTFDNWHSMGYGNDVVVIYAADGRLVRAFGLSEFLPDYYIAGLQHTVSSIWWRGDGKVDEARGQLVIPVAVPVVRKPGAIHERGARHVQIRFELADGALVPTSGTAWQDALASARSSKAARLDASGIASKVRRAARSTYRH